jgi:diaminopropionate ammonia-lyase
MLASVRAGELITVPGPHQSIMAGLNCDTPSILAFDTVRYGVDIFVSIDDAAVEETMRELSDVEIVGGESGVAGLAGLSELLSDPVGEQVRKKYGIDESSNVLVINTEGATDLDSYARIVRMS